MTIPTRTLGRHGLDVSAQGLGCMGMSEFYDPANQDDDESVRVIHRYLDAGGTFLDTANAYGTGRNEALVGRAVAGRREGVVIATKFGLVRGPQGEMLGIRGDAQYVRECAEASLTRLKVDAIDLYYQHRVDPSTPIEETVGALADLVAEGKIRHVGLSEAGPDTIRRAHAVHPIAALQTEYSLWTRDPEGTTLPVLRQLGIGLVAYSPLGRGMLTGTVRSVDQLDATDFRRTNPRFAADHWEHNLSSADEVRSIADEVGCTPAQVSLAWLLARGDDIVPIPGTKRRTRLEENVGADAVQLSSAQLARLDALTPPLGDHHNEAQMRMIER
jgi:aryl-alcohol dehydrogenase-like predicted oxidoreductase